MGWGRGPYLVPMQLSSYKPVWDGWTDYCMCGTGAVRNVKQHLTIISMLLILFFSVKCCRKLCYIKVAWWLIASGLAGAETSDGASNILPDIHSSVIWKLIIILSSSWHTISRPELFVPDSSYPDCDNKTWYPCTHTCYKDITCLSLTLFHFVFR